MKIVLTAHEVQMAERAAEALGLTRGAALNLCARARAWLVKHPDWVPATRPDEAMAGPEHYGEFVLAEVIFKLHHGELA